MKDDGDNIHLPWVVYYLCRVYSPLLWSALNAMLQLKVQLNVTEEKSCQKIFSFINCASKGTLEESSSCPPLGVNFWAKCKTGLCWQWSRPSLLSRWLCSLINIFLKILNYHQSVVFLLLLFLIISNFRLFQMPDLAVCLFFSHNLYIDRLNPFICYTVQQKSTCQHAVATHVGYASSSSGPISLCAGVRFIFGELHMLWRHIVKVYLENYTFVSNFFL